MKISPYNPAAPDPPVPGLPPNKRSLAPLLFAAVPVEAPPYPPVITVSPPVPAGVVAGRCRAPETTRDKYSRTNPGVTGPSVTCGEGLSCGASAWALATPASSGVVYTVADRDRPACAQYPGDSRYVLVGASRRREVVRPRDASPAARGPLRPRGALDADDRRGAEGGYRSRREAHSDGHVST